MPDDALEISDSDATYLSCIMLKPFYTIGSLYARILEGLVDRGLAKLAGTGYIISEKGKHQMVLHELKKAREEAAQNEALSDDPLGR